jgi:hypothetical protein
VASGSGSVFIGTPVGGFVTVPGGAAHLSLELNADSVGAWTGSMSLQKGIVSGAALHQTQWPSFMPGPSNEYGADVTALIDLPASVTVYADSAGNPKTGELPKSIVPKYLRSGTALSSGVTWSATTLDGNASFTISGSGAADLEITGPNNSTLALQSDIQVTGTYQGISRSAKIAVMRQDDPPTNTGSSGGGGGSSSSATTTTLGTTTGTAYDMTNAISATLTVTAGASGQVACTAPISFKRTPISLSTGPDGETGAAGKWQWRVVGGTFADIASEVTNATDSITSLDPDISKHKTSPGSLSVAQTKTGLTPGTAYEFRFCWRRIDVSPTAANVGLVGTSTLQAVGS